MEAPLQINSFWIPRVQGSCHCCLFIASRTQTDAFLHAYNKNNNNGFFSVIHRLSFQRRLVWKDHSWLCLTTCSSIIIPSMGDVQSDLTLPKVSLSSFSSCYHKTSPRKIFAILLNGFKLVQLKENMADVAAILSRRKNCGQRNNGIILAILSNKNSQGIKGDRGYKCGKERERLKSCKSGRSGVDGESMCAGI